MESEEEQGAEPRPFEPVSIDDFAAVDVNALTAEIQGFSRWDLDLPLIRAANAASEGEDPVRRRVTRLLAMLMGMHMRTESEGDPFGVQWRGVDKRTAIPDDFRETQAEVLTAIAPTREHPTLRARVADVAYESGLRRAGLIAIEAYCEISLRLIDIRSDTGCEDAQNRVMDVVDPLTRAFQINARVAKRGSFSGRLKEVTLAAHDFALKVRGYVAFTEIGRMLLTHRMIDPTTLAREAESLAATAPGTDYRLAVKQVWLLAADAYDRAGDAGASRTASVAAIEKTLGMKEDVPASAAKAHWVKMAIQEYRGLGGAQDRIDELKALMRDLQDASLDEYRTFRTRSEGLAEMREAVAKAFGECSLSDGLRAILDFIEPSDPAQQKAEALKAARAEPLSNLFSTHHTDEQGRTVSLGPALADEQPNEAWFKEHCIRNGRQRRHYLVGGKLEPVRQVLQERFSIQERHMLAIVGHSDFIPPGHHHLFSLGLARLWQGDYVTAGSLLIPQLENSLRYVLNLVGRDSSKIEDDGIQGDRPLNVLLSFCRSDLEAVFGPTMIWEIDALFNFRPGPAVRHQLAHGKLPWNGFYATEAISACWLIYYLVMVPTLDFWDSHVAPMLHDLGGEELREPSP